MMCEIPLTLEQKKFASDHHNLVYKFLHDRHLPIDEFYDIVIFGYLNAVKSYFSRADLHVYTFATLSWKLMTQSLTDYYKEQLCQKRNAEELSLHTMSCTDDLPFKDVLPASDNYLQQLEFTLLLHDLSNASLNSRWISCGCGSAATIFRISPTARTPLQSASESCWRKFAVSSSKSVMNDIHASTDFRASSPFPRRDPQQST